MTASLCPVFQEPQFTDNGEFLAGGLLWFYEAGTSTLAISYSDIAGTVPWTNPIVLNSRGECAGTIWLDQNTSYRITLESKPAYGQTHGVVITEHDNITGIASAQTPQDWVTFTGSPTFASTTSFTVIGDYRDIFVANRKLRITDSGGVSINSVISSTYGTSTTTVNVSGLIDSGISLVEYAFVTPDASPDRFVDLVVSDDMTVSGDSVLDGAVTIGGNTSIGGNAAVGGTLTINGNAAWTSANNTFGTSVSPNAGYINFANGLKFYRETFTVSWTSGATFIDGTKSFSSPMPTACLQVVACFGNIPDIALDNYTPIIFIPSVTASGFNYSLRASTGPASTTSVEVRIIAIGY